MKENDILQFRNIIQLIREEIRDKRIIYSQSQKRFIIVSSEYQLSKLQRWIFQNIKTQESIDMVNHCIRDVRIEKIDTTYTSYINVFIIENSDEKLLIEIFL